MAFGILGSYPETKSIFAWCLDSDRASKYHGTLK